MNHYCTMTISFSDVSATNSLRFVNVYLKYVYTLNYDNVRTIKQQPFSFFPQYYMYIYISKI